MRSAERRQFECAWCGEMFYAKRSHATCCSLRCRNSRLRARRAKAENKPFIKKDYGSVIQYEATVIALTTLGYEEDEAKAHIENVGMPQVSRMLTHRGLSYHHKFKQWLSEGDFYAQNNKGFVYLLKAVHPYNFYKIGRTKSHKNRINNIAASLPFAIEVECLISTDNMFEIETHLHQRFADKRLNGEWFELTDEDVAYIKSFKR